MQKTIGFIGLGIMGRPMVKNLITAGYPVVVFDINSGAVAKMVASGAKAAASSKEVAAASDVVITMLPNSQDVKNVVLGEEGVLQGARPGTILIDMSSIAPLVAKEIFDKAEEQGVAMLDAPVSGGEPKAIDGTLAIMAGGTEATFQKVQDIFSVLGSSAVLVGGPGSGAMTKLANQIIVNLNIAAMSEAMVLATKAGVDPGKVFEAIRGGLAGSTVLDAKMPKVLSRDFSPGGRIDINLKDITNVMDTSHEIGVPLPLTSQLLEILHALKVSGNLRDDHSGIVQFYERLAQVEVKGK